MSSNDSRSLSTVAGTGLVEAGSATICPKSHRRSRHDNSGRCRAKTGNFNLMCLLDKKMRRTSDIAALRGINPTCP